MDWVLDNLDLIGELTLIHLRQSILAIVIGFVLSVPLGWVAFRFRLLRSGIITVVGLLYTIPSLALLMILPTIFGYSAISEINLIVALTIYALAIMVRSVSDGLQSVDSGVRQASTAVGFGGAFLGLSLLGGGAAPETAAMAERETEVMVEGVVVGV